MKNETKFARQVHVSRESLYNKVREYHLRFMGKYQEYFEQKYLEQRSCPVCSSKKQTTLFKKSGGIYVHCSDCSMIFTNPVFKESALEFYYKNLNTGQASVVENESDFYKEIFSRGLSIIQRHSKVGDILDIGCSGGYFLDIARKGGWITSGIELGIEEAQLCQSRGHKVYTEYLEYLSFSKKFNVVTLWDVFEHIPNPYKYLKLIRSIIHPDGVVFLQIPNVNSLAARVLQERCNMFDGLEHVNLYNPSTIRKVSQENNFKIVQMSSVISECSVLNNYLHYSDPYLGNIKYEDPLLDLVTEQELHDKLLGYKLQIILKPITD